MVTQLTIAVKVKVGENEEEVLWSNFPVAIFTFELTNFLRSDEARVAPVDTFKSGVGFKVPNGSQYLPHLFDRYLLLCYVKEQLLQF